ncbi:nuclear transport factor 2 family protein [Cronobacter dublinensis]|uniref:nuclear transport factor 2 family protein n=1 Tax=Cronobacter dublinensis TaxID=413497 RepID=UPI000CFDE0F2|nr:nuclear transport factor 2 family protein [Cronobacter dublinensis]
MLLNRLTALECSLHGAQRHDPAWLEAILHPHFCEITRSGTLVNRREAIDALTHETDAAAIVSAGFTLLPVTPDGVILRYRTSAPDGSRPAWRSSHWVRVGDDRWQLIFHQGTPAR